MPHEIGRSRKEVSRRQELWRSGSMQEACTREARGMQKPARKQTEADKKCAEGMHDGGLEAGGLEAGRRQA